MTLFTVDPSGWLKCNSPVGVSVYNGHSYYFYNTQAPCGAVSHWWWRFEVYKQSYTDYRKVFTYTRTVSEEKESSTAVTEGGGISNVKHLVKYTF